VAAGPFDYETTFSDYVNGDHEGRALYADQQTLAIDGADGRRLPWVEWRAFNQNRDLRPVAVTFTERADWHFTAMMNIAARAAMQVADTPQLLNGILADRRHVQVEAGHWLRDRLVGAVTTLGRFGIFGATHSLYDDRRPLD